MKGEPEAVKAKSRLSSGKFKATLFIDWRELLYTYWFFYERWRINEQFCCKILSKVSLANRSSPHSSDPTKNEIIRVGKLLSTFSL